MFAECLDLYGWHKRAEFECREFYGQFDYEKKLKDKLDYFQHLCTNQQTTFCQLNNCEFAPEVCNEFVTVYLEDPGRNKGKVQKQEIIDLTQHLCHWLFTNKLTCSRLSMIGAP
jgi:hypothetical protein